MSSQTNLSTSSAQSTAANFVRGLRTHSQALMLHIKYDDGHAHNDVPQDDEVPSNSNEQAPSVLTRYMRMLLQLDDIPSLQNFLAGFFTWILLTGHMVFPGTFTSLRHSKTVQDAAGNDKAGNHIVDTVQNVPLLWLAAICCISVTSGMCWLWWKWQENFVWLINRIFLPGLLHSVAGLITTLVNVYSAQGGSWSVTATITSVVTGTCTGTTLALFLVYNNWLLVKVKKAHEGELSAERNRLLRT